MKYFLDNLDRIGQLVSSPLLPTTLVYHLGLEHLVCRPKQTTAPATPWTSLSHLVSISYSICYVPSSTYLVLEKKLPYEYGFTPCTVRNRGALAIAKGGFPVTLVENL